MQGSHASWKVLENEFGHLHYTIRLLADLACYRQIWRHPGPGKWVWSWKVLEFARQWCRRYNMRVHTPLLCSSSFFAIPSQHVTVMNIYSSMNAAIILYIYMVSNCCLCLYLNIAGLPRGPGKCFWVHGKVLEFFCNQESGNPVYGWCHICWLFVARSMQPDGATWVARPG